MQMKGLNNIFFWRKVTSPFGYFSNTMVGSRESESRSWAVYFWCAHGPFTLSFSYDVAIAGSFITLKLINVDHVCETNLWMLLLNFVNCLKLHFFQKRGNCQQGHNEVRWRPGQEASLTPPCSNLRSFWSKCTAWKKTCNIVGTFRRPPQSFGTICSHSAPLSWFGARRIVLTFPPSLRPSLETTEVGTKYTQQSNCQTSVKQQVVHQDLRIVHTT